MHRPPRHRRRPRRQSLLAALLAAVVSVGATHEVVQRWFPWIDAGTTPVLYVSSARGQGCAPEPAPVDPDATEATRCLAETLDRLRDQRLMAVGQEVLIGGDDWAEPLRALGPDHAPRVVGFDLAEVVDGEAHGVRSIDALAARARDERLVLTASWHAPNPWTGGGATDLTRPDEGLAALLEDTPAARAFWASWRKAAGVLVDLDRFGLPVVVRPLHEAGGDWFWWGTPDPEVYRALFARLQQVAADAGAHNVLWAYAAAVPDRAGIADPASLLPAAIDLAGIDGYDCEDASCHGSEADVAPVAGYAELAAVAPRMALTEIGPRGGEGTWDPAVVPAALVATPNPPAYALFWVDDETGPKQLSSLSGTDAWLAACGHGLCPVP